MIKCIEDFFLNLPLIILFSITAYTLGFFLSHFIKGTHKKLPFADTMTFGVISIVTLFAVVSTWGNTFLIIPVILVLAFGIHQKLFSFQWYGFMRFDIRKLCYFILLFSVISFGMIVLVSYDNRLVSHPDLSIYARLSHFLASSGSEQLVVDPIYFSEYSKDLYHYFNEWLTAIGMTIIKGESALKLFLGFTIPCISSLLFIQIYDTSKQIDLSINWIDRLLLSLFILFIPNITKTIYHILIDSSPSSSILHSGLYFLKLKIVILIAVISFKYYLKNRENLALFTISLLPVFWHSLLPAFLLGFISLLIYKLITKKTFNTSLLITQCAIYISFIVIILLNTIPQDSVFTFSIFDYLSSEISHAEYVNDTVILLFFSFLIFSAIFFKFIRRFINNYYMDFLFFILIATLISFAFLDRLHNAIQVLVNLLLPLLLVFAFYIIFSVVRVFNPVFRIGIPIVLVGIFIYAYLDKEMIGSKIVIPKEFKTSSTTYVASDINLSTDSFYAYIRPYSYHMLDHMYWQPMNIDIFNNVKIKSTADKYQYYQSVKNQSFYSFIKQHKAYEDIENHKFYFLREYKIEYLLINKQLLEGINTNYLSQLSIDEETKFDTDILLLKLKWD